MDSEEIFLKGRDVYELAVAALVNSVLDSQRTAFAPPAGTGKIEEIKDCVPQLTALVGFLTQEKYGGMPLRADLQRMFKDLIDASRQSVSAVNHVSRLFSTVLWPFVLWYNSSRRALDPLWESSTWYKDKGKWNQPGDVSTMLPAFAVYRGFTPVAQAATTSSVIP
jgi:hypothetical protein